MNYKFDTDIFGFHNIGSGGALKEGLASMGSSKEDNRAHRLLRPRDV